MGELVRGLADTDIKTIVLGEVEQKTELDELIKLIQAKEYAKSSTSAASTSVNALSFTDNDPCPNCAGTHTKAPGWRESCPAKGKKCLDCKKIGHFKAACKSRPRKNSKKAKPKTEKKKAQSVDEESEESGDDSNALDEELGYLFAFTAAEKKIQKKQRQRNEKLNKLATSPIPHLVWNGGHWRVRSNKKAPMVGIKYFLSEDGYKAAKSCIPLRCLLYTSPSPRDATLSRMPSSA